MKKTSFAMLVAASLVYAGVAAASTADNSLPDSVQVDSTIVEFDAETARTAPGARLLFDRIRKAAYEVCMIGSHPVGHDRWMQHACEARAVDRAVRSVSIPAVTRHLTGRDERTLITAR